MQDNNACPCEFYPDAVPEKWDDIEVHPVFDDGKGNVEPCKKEEDASYFSVYLHDVNGGIQCVADCQLKEQAEALGNLLEKVSKNWQAD